MYPLQRLSDLLEESPHPLIPWGIPFRHSAHGGIKCRRGNSGAARSADAPALAGCPFAESGVWLAHVRTRADGSAAISVIMPKARAAWRLVAVAVDRQTRVGEGGLQLATK